MAIYTPSTDYSSLRQAYATKADITQAGHNITQQDINTQLLKQSEKSLDVQQAMKNTQDFKLIVDAAIDSLQIISQVDTLVKQKELEKAKTTALDASMDLTRIIIESVLNGGTQAIQGPDGKWSIEMDPAVTEWYNNQQAAISASKDSKEVKLWRMRALTQTFATGQNQILSTVLKDTMTTIDQQHDLNIQAALQTDAVTGTYEMGEAQINSRADLSPAQKALQIQAYQKTVDFNHQNQNISNLAATEGLAKATEYAYSLNKNLPPEKQFTPEQIQSFVKTASVTDQQLSNAITTNVATAMANGLETGKAPAALYEQINSYTEDMPENRQQLAAETAKAAHIVWATAQGYKIANEDLQSVDIEYLTDRMNSILDPEGELNQTIFAGLDKTTTTFAAMYEKRIDELEKLESTTLANQNKEQIKENKAIADATFAMLQQGQISPAEAIAGMQNLDRSLATDGFDDDLYQTQMINKINDNIVPEQYKAITKDFLKKMETLKYGIKIDKKKDITPEQSAQLADATYFANEAIANIFMNTAAKDLNPAQVSEQLQKIQETFVGKAVKALESGEVVDKWRPFYHDLKAIDDALSKLHTFASQEGSIPVQKDRNGTFVWSNPNYKATFDAIGGELTNLLSSEGVTPTSLPTPVTIYGEARPVPMIQGVMEGQDGRVWFTVNQNDIFYTSDPTGSDGWQYWKSIETKAKFKGTSEIDRYFDYYRSGKPHQTWYEQQKAKDPDNRHKQQYNPATLRQEQQDKKDKDPQGLHKYL